MNLQQQDLKAVELAAPVGQLSVHLQGMMASQRAPSAAGPECRWTCCTTRSALRAPAGQDAASLMGRLRPRSPTKAALRAKAEAKQQAEADAQLRQAGLLRQPRDGQAPHPSLSTEQSTLPVSCVQKVCSPACALELPDMWPAPAVSAVPADTGPAVHALCRTQSMLVDNLLSGWTPSHRHLPIKNRWQSPCWGWHRHIMHVPCLNHWLA